ncbi:hypothetical protein [Moraxella lacunata]|uniref:hypothetical protein n=1 Tax=Moraxella lacunata TaxID=477 RepID=UPI003EE0608E
MKYWAKSLGLAHLGLFWLIKELFCQTIVRPSPSRCYICPCRQTSRANLHT